MVNSFGDALGFFGSIGSALANSAGVQNNVDMQKNLMRYQALLNYKYSQKDLKTKWSANRTGLENAGYNPMLALAGVTSNSSWASPQSVSDNNAGATFGTGVANALQARNLAQQNNLIQSQVENNNADSELKRQQAVTETYDQLQKQVHADLEDTYRQLQDKDLSTYDEKFLLFRKKTLQEIETMNIQNQVGLTQATANMIQAQASRTNANANARDVESKAKQREYQNTGYGYDNYIKGLKTQDFSKSIIRSIYSYPGFHSPY